MRSLRALIAEDSADDILLITDVIEQAGFSLISLNVQGAAEMGHALAERDWDIVLSDFSMPQFTAFDALTILQESRQADLPFIIVSGSIDGASAVTALKAGASNYVMKDHLGELVPSIEHELAAAQARRERRDAIAALEQAVAARDEFLSIASHELKTPLTTLRLQAQGLLHAAKLGDGSLLGNGAVLRRLDIIDRNAERLVAIVDRMLEVSRVSSGQLRLTRERVDLGRVVDRVLADMHDVLVGAGCTVIREGATQLVGRWDSDRIETVITNLLSNAAKYGAHKPIRIRLEDFVDRVQICVTDEGLGISGDDQQRIFGRFERAVPEKHYGGFGVGLWLSQRIVEAHAGTIEVRSQPREGSTFKVTLPKDAA